ncbi:MAG: flagellar basal-body MS-ring/collar protein FliF, partial [Syntrophothermus sp.]
MNAWLQKLRPQIVQLWQGLNPSRRIIMSVGAAAIVGIVILVASYAGHPEFVPLFTQLDASDAGEIVAKLKEDGIPYQIAEGGSAILVPGDKVYETRISLASAGMPRGGIVGFELFDDNKLGTTDFDRKLKYTRALQGELTRTIREINGVEDARVHIVRPEQSLFIDEKKEPTASVLLKLQPSARLSEEQIRGIANLLAGSVEGLDPLKVTILDSQGNVLSQVLKDNADADLAMGSNAKNKLIMERLSIQRQQEKELEKSVQSMLERVFGPGKAVARVSAEMNFDYEESSSELYQPSVGDFGIIRSEQESSESYRGQGTGPAMGVPGVTSNIPGYQAVDSGNNNSQYQKREVTRNYEVSKRQEHLVSSPGKIRRLSVAVWVSGRLGPQQIASVRSLVASAVGYNEARGDQISVESLQIEPEQ